MPDVTIVSPGSVTAVINVAALQVTGATTFNSGVTFANPLTISSATVKTTLDISGLLTYSARLKHANESSVNVSTSKTLAVSDSGYCITVSSSGVTLTLPATVAGLYYTLLTMATVAGAAAPAFTPNVSDRIAGCGVVGIDGGFIKNWNPLSGADLAVVGDRLEIVGDGGNGWNIVRKFGTWSLSA